MIDSDSSDAEDFEMPINYNVNNAKGMYLFCYVNKFV